jgi:hypothetical protein
MRVMAAKGEAIVGVRQVQAERDSPPQSSTQAAVHRPVLTSELHTPAVTGFELMNVASLNQPTVNMLGAGCSCDIYDSYECILLYTPQPS